MLGHWNVVAALLIWWYLSRAFKILPHLRRRPVDLAILPIFIGITYYMTFIKTYALCTLNEHKWLTRAVAVVDGKVARVNQEAQIVSTVPSPYTTQIVRLPDEDQTIQEKDSSPYATQMLQSVPADR